MSPRADQSEKTEPPPPLRPGRGQAGPLRLWRDGFRALGPDRPRLLLTGMLAVLSGFLETVLLYLIARLALILTEDPGTVTVGGIGPIPERDATTGWIVAVAALILVVLVVLAIPLMRSVATLSTRSLVRTRSRLIDAYLGASWAQRSSEREGHFAQMVGEYCQRTEQLVVQISIVVVAICQITMLMTGALVANPLAAAVSILGLIVLAVALRPLSKGVREGSNKNAAGNQSVVNDSQQVMRLGAEVTSFNVGPAVAESLEGKVRRAARQLHRVRFISRLVPTLYQYSALGVILAVVGVLTVLDTGDLSGLAPVILLLIRALTYLRQLVTAAQAGSELSPYFEVLEEEIRVLELHRPAPGNRDLSDFRQVEFIDVDFEYEPGRPVLSGVGFSFSQNEIVGLVGASGGGKTTLIQLLLRLREPVSGRITVDGVDLRDLTSECWSRLTAYVPQENKLVLASVADNIRFFRPEFSLEQVEDAARRAHLHDEIAAWPEGYETLVGPGARTLSGGQCQRLGIARALLGCPDLLVLDEPTSALDPLSETLIRQTVAEVAREAAVVIVAHRPATLAVCTRLLNVEGHSVRPTEAWAAEAELTGPGEPAIEQLSSKEELDVPSDVGR